MARTTKDQLNKAHAIFGSPIGEPRIYRIIRFRFQGTNRTVRTGLTLTEAQAWCSREDTHGPGWFDGYDLMRGIKA